MARSATGPRSFVKADGRALLEPAACRVVPSAGSGGIQTGPCPFRSGLRQFLLVGQNTQRVSSRPALQCRPPAIDRYSGPSAERGGLQPGGVSTDGRDRFPAVSRASLSGGVQNMATDNDRALHFGCRCPRPVVVSGARRPSISVPLLAYFPFVIETLINGQLTAVVFFGLSMAIRDDKRQKPLASGVWVAACAYRRC
jgi:hypothetical protein